MRIVPVVQSILCLERSELSGVEILCRLEVGSVLASPFGFVTSDQWPEIDLGILERGVELAPLLNRVCPRVFINVSAQSLASESAYMRWRDKLDALLLHLQIPLVVEISENVDHSLLRLRWQSLSNIPKLELAIDDFGDKHSSMNRLLDYPWHFCKFDARYLTKISHLVAMFMCQSSKTQTVVERVETAATSLRCLELGLYRQQGFLFSMPSRIDEWLEQHKEQAWLLQNAGT